LGEEPDEAAVDFIRNRKPFKRKRCADLHERRAGLDLGESGFRVFDTANADQGKLFFHAEICGCKHLGRKPKQGPA